MQLELYKPSPPPSTKLDNSAAYCYVIGGGKRQSSEGTFVRGRLKGTFGGWSQEKHFKTEVRRYKTQAGVRRYKSASGLEGTNPHPPIYTLSRPFSNRSIFRGVHVRTVHILRIVLAPHTLHR